MPSASHREKLSRALMRRPTTDDTRQYVFWLVDVIYACKAANDQTFLAQARLLEDALGHFSRFLELGEADDLQQLEHNLDLFAQFVRQEEGAAGLTRAAGSAQPRR